MNAHGAFVVPKHWLGITGIKASRFRVKSSKKEEKKYLVGILTTAE